MANETSPSKLGASGKTEQPNGRLANGHDALDLAETAEGAAKQSAERLVAKRNEHERARQVTREKFEEQMRQLEAEQLAEEHQIITSSPASEPTTPPGHREGDGEGHGDAEPAPIGPPGNTSASAAAGAGAKSMPASRRTSGYGGGSFGFEKLSLSVMEPGQAGKWDDDVDERGAEGTVNYLGMGDDDYVPKERKHLSANSAALDLAPLSQTPPRGYGSRPFDTSIKTSEWSTFPQHRTSTSPLATSKRTLTDAPHSAVDHLLNGASGMADSIASLPALPSKSVPGTPFGLGAVAGAGGSGANGVNGVKRSGTSPNIADGMNAPAQRGFSNPDLARTYGGKGNVSFNLADQARPYGADPIYTNMFSAAPNGLPANAAVAAAFTPNNFTPYAFEDDPTGYGSGALYSTGTMGIKNKRSDADREFNRFSGVRIEDLQGEILLLTKDQHGCRYLQKVLEDGDPQHRDLIFNEVYGHYPELMTDPFGNYLCQKILEVANEEQISGIVESVSNELVGISLNMHGTRAVQKMVDFLASPRQAKQIRTLIYALSMNVVALIKDLNGNHVIQKCLNKLIPEDNQFIYNAIAANLIEVATHRHGCCVLQRSIDHASPAQRVQLVTEIIFNSLYLVQDPFGNYVIQYILDLNDARFSEPLIRTFIGNVCSLSVQKFSSNVVEKCIRVADAEIRKLLVVEILNRSRLEKLLRDSYGNYVVQTILDYCDPAQRMMLIDMIRPLLPSIRNTPYGKRIQSKLAREDSSFGHPSLGYGNGGGGGGRGGRGNYQPGYQRHLGRPQLQHINALTDVYGSQGGPFGAPGHAQPGAGYMPQHMGHPGHHHPQQLHGQGQHHSNFRPGPAQHAVHPNAMQPDHTGLSYHAPGPDGAQWLHLRAGGAGGGAGSPANGNGNGNGGSAPSAASAAAAAAAPWADMSGLNGDVDFQAGLGQGQGGWPAQYGFDPHGLGQPQMGQHQMM